MKKLLLMAGFAVGLLAARPAAAQYYATSFLNAGRNPGGLNTDTEQASQVGWSRILFGLNPMNTNPVWTQDQVLPFAFQFNGQAVTDYKVSSSGVLTFDLAATTVPSGANTALPSPQIPNKSVCVWGLGARSGDYIETKTFGTAPNRQHWVQFNSYSDVSNTNVAYTYWAIVLEEGSNKIYVVDQHTGYNALTPALTLTVGVQINGTTAEQLPASPNVNTTTTYTDDDTPVDNTYYSFTPGLRPAYDVALKTLTLPAVASRQNAIPVTGTLENLGGLALNSYSVNYQVNNGPAVSGTVTGTSVGTLNTAPFTAPTAWQPAASGRYSLKVWLSNPNGQPDLDHSNDTLRTSVLVGDSTMRRLVVEECFTSSTCPPCRPGNQIVETVNHQNPGKHVVIKYQQNFPAPGQRPVLHLRKRLAPGLLWHQRHSVHDARRRLERQLQLLHLAPS
jgi:thiol-disulfide isomerase/thioredoxin